MTGQSILRRDFLTAGSDFGALLTAWDFRSKGTRLPLVSTSTATAARASDCPGRPESLASSARHCSAASLKIFFSISAGDCLGPPQDKHEDDLMGGSEPVVSSAARVDLVQIGIEKAGIKNQPGTGNVRVGGRH